MVLRADIPARGAEAAALRRLPARHLSHQEVGEERRFALLFFTLTKLNGFVKMLGGALPT